MVLKVDHKKMLADGISDRRVILILENLVASDNTDIVIWDHVKRDVRLRDEVGCPYISTPS